MEDQEMLEKTQALYGRINKLKGTHGDPERDHGEEDSIMEEALRLIAVGHPDPAVLAYEVLTLVDMGLEKWYA